YTLFMPNVLQSKVFPLASLQVYVQVSSALSSQGISTSSSCAKASTLARLIADNSFRSFVLKFTLKAAAAAMMATTKIPKILFFIFNLLFTLNNCFHCVYHFNSLHPMGYHC